MKLSPGYLRDNLAAFKNRYINAAHHMLSEQGRLVVVSSWNDIGIISPDAKIVVPFG